jgi:cytoskeleton protein RodZ
MSSLGPYLRDLRQRHGVSVDDISRATRIGREYLEALETGDLAKLPAPVFVRGFIRAYCQALGEPVDEGLERYGERVSGDVPHPEPGPARVARSRRSSSLAVSFALLVVLGVALFFTGAWLRSGRERLGVVSVSPASEGRAAVPLPIAPGSPAARSAPAPPAADVPASNPSQTGRLAGSAITRTEPPPPTAAAPAVATERPARTSSGPAVSPPEQRSAVAAGRSDGAPGGSPSASPIQKEPESVTGNGDTRWTPSPPYRLVARTTERTWIRVRTEDGHATEEEIPPGQVREWVSNRQFTLTVGNAGGLSLELNGRPLPALGTRGEVVRGMVLPGGQTPPGGGATTPVPPSR